MAVRNPLRTGWESLQSTLTQSVETVTRTARIDISGTGVDELDPPDEIDEYWGQYKSTGIVRSNINQYVSDVTEPGARIEADDDATRDYFMGGDDAPESTPEGGFLKNCAVHAGEKHNPFYPLLKTTIANRWVRGTALVEKLKADREDPESPITGFYLILPESVYPQVYSNKNILLDPDPDAPANEDIAFELTPRGEVASYIQFDDESILGRVRGRFGDRDSVPLSQNDVLKQTLDPDIGGDDTNEQGIWGTSVMEAISTDVEEYKQIKRDRHASIQTKAYGIWLAVFGQEVLEVDETSRELIEWETDSQDDFSSELESLGPGDVLQADGPIDLEEFRADVPDLDETLKHYVDDITAPLPAPKYSVGFEKDINQFVTERQETRYEDLIDEERRYQERKWTSVFREVAERHPDLDPEGLRLRIEPEEDDSPILSLSDEEIDRLLTYSEALDLLAGPTAGPATLVRDETLRELIAQLPEEAEPEPEVDVDETDPEVEAAFEQFAVD